MPNHQKTKEEEPKPEKLPLSRPSRQLRPSAVATLALLALFLTSVIILVVRLAGYKEARDEYANLGFIVPETMLAETAAPPSSPPTHVSAPSPTASTETATPAPTATPFISDRVAALLKQNRDAIGWLSISGADIQYPVVQGTDNEYYMTHTFLKKKNASGAIFMDCWNLKDFSDFNTVIYGHNMNDGSMFAGLRKYRHQWFFNANPYIEITLLNKTLVYRVFAAYTSRSEDNEDFRGYNCNTEEQRAEFIKTVRARSTGIRCSYTVSRHDRLLTLVTCTGNARTWYWVVHAVLVREEG